MWEPAWSCRNWHKSTERSQREWLHCLSQDNVVKTFFSQLCSHCRQLHCTEAQLHPVHNYWERCGLWHSSAITSSPERALCLQPAVHSLAPSREKRDQIHRVQSKATCVPFTSALLKTPSKPCVTWLVSFDDVTPQVTFHFNIQIRQTLI